MNYSDVKTAENATNKDGRILPGSSFGMKIGFTFDKFDGWLWHEPPFIVISFIESRNPGRGNLSQLFKTIQESGFRIRVPTPLGRMVSILEKKGFTPSLIEDETFGSVEVWDSPPPKPNEPQHLEKQTHP